MDHTEVREIARPAWHRSSAFLAAAAIATGAGVGMLVKVTDRPASEVTCAELTGDFTASLELAEELTGEDLESDPNAVLGLIKIVEGLDRACERADDPEYRPVNSDFRGSFRRELRER